MNMIEKVARAMCIAEGLDPDILCYRSMPQKYTNGLFIAPNPLMCYPAWTFNTIAARAAIEAMRELNEGILNKLTSIHLYQDDHYSNEEAKEVWSEIIDAALKEE